MFVYHFVDPDLRIEIIFRKEGTAENEGVELEKGYVGTSAHHYLKSEKISSRACPLFYCCFGDKI